ncbi:unnamed protein product [Brachionus calyciflorus]|uniref:Uncharacterized protein n=1 Tax=Brachionus calyciflorus TaxID=104777 RepID=A0A813XFH0_9BILA|nr:unnamed protein product [Brachionus calyciflorus]
MAPKAKKSASKDDESKKNKLKKNPTVEDGESEINKDETQVSISVNDVYNSTSELSKQEPSITPEETVQITYEEPVLTSIIVESYTGEKDKGLFEGFGKAMYKGGCIYEGEFHLGLMHGKGTYIWPNGIIYEGDFNNNEITGNGIYRWCTKINDPSKWSTYKGQVYKGKRHGYGVFKSGNSPIVYDGEWHMGKRYGKGKMTYDSKGLSFYQGDWVNNKKFGWGIRHYPSGNVYQGMWVNDIRHGDGTMRWFDKNQIYTGQWENGIQNGLGEHNWYLSRVEMTQYTLRNTYFGNFKNGKRHGQGTFLYANGTKYEGNWENDIKHGWGKFTFKDGRVYEGYFEDDKMTDSPTYKRTSKISQEISKIKTRIPSAGTTLNVHYIRTNQETTRHDFDLKLDLSSIIEDFDDDKIDFETTQAHKTIIRYLDLFKQIYRFYSQLGFDSSPDNTFVLNRMQSWRFMKDCKIHLNEHYLTLMDFDRLLNPKMNANDLHCPFDKILMRDFFNHIVIIAYHLYNEQFEGNGSVLSWCIEKLIVDNILPSSCNVQGYFYSDVRKTLNIIPNMLKAYEIYKFICKKRNKSPHDFTLTMRDFLGLLNDFKILDAKLLSTREIIEVMSSDNPIVYDSENAYNLDLEITFLEFFEILIGCALKYNTKKNLNKKRVLTSKLTLNSEQEASDNNQINEITANEINENKEDKINIHDSDDVVESDEKSERQGDVLNSAKTNQMKLSSKLSTKSLNNNENEDLDFEIWIEKNNYFFNQIFFPAAEKYNTVTKLVNLSI